MRSRFHFIALVAAPLTALASCHSISARKPSGEARDGKDADVYLAHPLIVGQLVLHPDFQLPRQHRMLTELVAERQLICDRLNLPASHEPIHVYLFAEEASYRQHVSRKFPEFPERRAIFVETDVELSVFAHWGEAIADDLRHEVAHGYLHAVVPNLPLWIDEGLAEYFEVGRGRRGVNRLHVEYLSGQLAVGGWRPNLPRLEQLMTAAEMTQLDYAEAWLWVHFLLESDAGEASLLQTYLAELHGDGSAAPLSDRIRDRVENAEAALLEHLKSVNAPAKTGDLP